MDAAEALIPGRLTGFADGETSGADRRGDRRSAWGEPGAERGVGCILKPEDAGLDVAGGERGVDVAWRPGLGGACEGCESDSFHGGGSSPSISAVRPGPVMSSQTVKSVGVSVLIRCVTISPL